MADSAAPSSLLPACGQEHWSSAWSVNAVWEVLYVLVLLAIAVLWAPSRHANKYAYYSAQLKTFDPDEHGGGDGYGNGDDEDDNEEDDDDIGEGDMEAEYGGSLEDDRRALTLTGGASGGEKLK